MPWINTATFSRSTSHLFGTLTAMTIAVAGLSPVLYSIQFVQLPTSLCWQFFAFQAWALSGIPEIACGILATSLYTMGKFWFHQSITPPPRAQDTLKELVLGKPIPHPPVEEANISDAPYNTAQVRQCHWFYIKCLCTILSMAFTTDLLWLIAGIKSLQWMGLVSVIPWFVILQGIGYVFLTIQSLDTVRNKIIPWYCHDQEKHTMQSTLFFLKKNTKILIGMFLLINWISFSTVFMFPLILWTYPAFKNRLFSFVNSKPVLTDNQELGKNLKKTVKNIWEQYYEKVCIPYFEKEKLDPAKQPLLDQANDLVSPHPFFQTTPSTSTRSFASVELEMIRKNYLYQLLDAPNWKKILQGFTHEGPEASVQSFDTTTLYRKNIKKLMLSKRFFNHLLKKLDAELPWTIQAGNKARIDFIAYLMTACVMAHDHHTHPQDPKLSHSRTITPLWEAYEHRAATPQLPNQAISLVELHADEPSRIPTPFPTP